MRGCLLLKCSNEQVRKATDAEWLGAELSKTVATELLRSRQRSGQRGYVDVQTEGQPTEEPPADTRPDVNQILEAVVPAPSVLAPIPEENDSMDTTIPEVAESGPEIRPRQPESEPGSEPVDRNVRPRLAPDQEMTQLDEVENSHANASEISARHQTKFLWKICLELHLQYLFRCRWCPPAIIWQFFLLKPSLTRKHRQSCTGVSTPVTERDSTTFEAIEGMAVFDSETQSFWVAPRPKDKSGVAYDELSETDKKKIDPLCQDNS